MRLGDLVVLFLFAPVLLVYFPVALALGGDMDGDDGFGGVSRG